MQVFYSILVIVFLLVLSFALPLWLQRRAIISVIKIFREKNALDMESAITRDALGIKPRTFMERMLKMRDYKPDALKFLLSAKIVRVTDDDRLYFSGEQLAFFHKEGKSKILRFLLPKQN